MGFHHTFLFLMLINNDNTDNLLVYGDGWAYGAEFFLKKTEGAFTGWIGYTWAKTERRFPDINEGNIYPAKYDRRHDLNVVGTYKLNETWTFGASFIYATGNTLTLPASWYVQDQNLLFQYGPRNSTRMAPYHRLDLSATRYGKAYKVKTDPLTGQDIQVKKAVRSNWSFSIYNVYKRLSESSPATPKEALPVISFNDKLQLHINGEDVLVFHVENAHTDGDALLYFTQSNVLHTGDTFFSELYPYIDLDSGGSINGYIKAVKKALILIDDDTKIIPGHGKLSNKVKYQFFLSMLEDLKTKVLAEIESGKTEEDVAANTAITKTYDDLGYSWAFINSERIRRTLYKSLKQ